MTSNVIRVLRVMRCPYLEDDLEHTLGLKCFNCSMQRDVYKEFWKLSLKGSS